jgi:two-component system, sensor histidine kinase ChiS
VITNYIAKKNYILLIFIFLIVLSSLRLTWIHFNRIPDHPVVKNGVLDLRDWQFDRKQTITLDGKWSFFPHTLLNTVSHTSKTFITVPDDWRNVINLDGPLKHPYGFGTYQLKILLPKDRPSIYGLKVPGIPTASKVLINGKSVATNGHPSETAETIKAKVLPKTVYFTDESDILTVTIQVANFHYAKSGGLTKSLQFGTGEAISRSTKFSHAMQLMACLIFFLHILYACILYFLGARRKELIYFAMLLICTTLTILLDDDRLLLHVLPIPFNWFLKTIYLAYIGLHLFTLLFVNHLVPNFKKGRMMRLFLALFGLSAFAMVVAPFQTVPLIAIFIHLQGLATFILVLFSMIRKIRNGEMDAIFLLMAIISILSSAIWGISKDTLGLRIGYYPFDMIIAIICFASYLFRQLYIMTARTKRMAEQLQKIDKLKDDFLANTSHELRNPLHGMMNIAHSLLEDEVASGNEKKKQKLQLLLVIGRRLSHIVNDLLDISRLKAEQIRLYKQRIELLPIASGVLDMVRFMTEGKNLNFILKIPQYGAAVWADENRLIQILFNLLHNAIKFTTEGFIKISAEIKNDHVLITIEDTGIGMDDSTLERIFSPYEQGVFHSSPNEGGIGLGLKICKQLVELQGGTLSASSTVGKGSVFSFTLPLARELDLTIAATEVAAAEENRSDGHDGKPITKNEPPIKWLANDLKTILKDSPETFQSTDKHFGKAEPIADSATHHSRVLLVDDDPINLKVFHHILSSHYDVITATSGKEALSQLAKGEWDLVISDVMMPHMSGYELTQKIRGKFSISELPILLLTARSQPEDIYTGFLAGANDYIIKPVNTLELKSRVFALTTVKRSVREQLGMEAAWLQAQIQPHFLFNTLNTIASLSEIDASRMHRLLEHFGNYLKRSFDVQNSSSLVPIEHELELLRSYLYIEKERFGTRLQLEWDIDECITLQVPPLSIQPIVENAVKHGVLRKASGGRVSIRLLDRAAYFEIIIQDDGVGMNAETVQQLLISRPNQRKGIGLWNTERRLKQLYGKGLQIDSMPGQGTTVSFQIPKQ